MGWVGMGWEEVGRDGMMRLAWSTACLPGLGGQ